MPSLRADTCGEGEVVQARIAYTRTWMVELVDLCGVKVSPVETAHPSRFCGGTPESGDACIINGVRWEHDGNEWRRQPEVADDD